MDGNKPGAVSVATTCAVWRISRYPFLVQAASPSGLLSAVLSNTMTGEQHPFVSGVQSRGTPTRWSGLRPRASSVSLTVKVLAITSTLLFSIGCTTEHHQPPPPAQPPAPVATVVDSSLLTPPIARVVDSSVKTPPAGSASFPDSEAAPIEPNIFLDTSEKTAIRTSQGKATRLGAELHIQLLDGKTVTFKDERSPHFLLPRYAGYLKTIHSHVVHGVPMEGSGYYEIIDDSTGDSTFVHGVPVPSPDGKRFVVMSMVDAGAGYDPGLIQVWRMVGRILPDSASHQQ